MKIRKLFLCMMLIISAVFVVPAAKGYAAEEASVEKLIPVKKDGKWGYVNTKGKEVIKCRYDGIIHRDEGRYD